MRDSNAAPATVIEIRTANYATVLTHGKVVVRKSVALLLLETLFARQPGDRPESNGST